MDERAASSGTASGARGAAEQTGRQRGGDEKTVMLPLWGLYLLVGFEVFFAILLGKGRQAFAAWDLSLAVIAAAAWPLYLGVVAVLAARDALRE